VLRQLEEEVVIADVEPVAHAIGNAPAVVTCHREQVGVSIHLAARSDRLSIAQAPDLVEKRLHGSNDLLR
jgi:hypothetical protein